MSNAKSLNKMAEQTLHTRQPAGITAMTQNYINSKNNLDNYHKNIADELEEYAGVKGLAAALGSKVAIPAAVGMAGYDMAQGFNDASTQYPYKTTGWQKTAGALDGLAHSLSAGLIPKGYISNSISSSTKEQMLEGLRRQQQIDEIASWKSSN